MAEAAGTLPNLSCAVIAFCMNMLMRKGGTDRCWAPYKDASGNKVMLSRREMLAALKAMFSVDIFRKTVRPPTLLSRTASFVARLLSSPAPPSALPPALRLPLPLHRLYGIDCSAQHDDAFAILEREVALGDGRSAAWRKVATICASAAHQDRKRMPAPAQHSRLSAHAASAEANTWQRHDWRNCQVCAACPFAKMFLKGPGLCGTRPSFPPSRKNRAPFACIGRLRSPLFCVPCSRVKRAGSNTCYRGRSTPGAGWRDARRQGLPWADDDSITSVPMDRS